jgi:hypothetical protein
MQIPTYAVYLHSNVGELIVWICNIFTFQYELIIAILNMK